ncbi:uncharacterized protein [Lepeophtheirus salmonis]|uniref:uncharacterized protein n=1 Tax=Lepeophtheirus salmonis TaxID=72036 RepID=UPI003AF39625
MILEFQQCNSLKQNIGNTPHKFKFCARSSTSGILYDFEQYVGKITTVSHKNNKPVTIASAYVGNNQGCTVKLWQVAEKKHINFPVPTIVKEYKPNLGGVDLNEMLVALYRIKIDVKRILYHFVDAAIVNSWLMYFMTFQKPWFCQILKKKIFSKYL